MPRAEKFQQLPAPWDRIFSLGTRVFVWGLLIGILYILRPFFLLIFLTFVFAYVQSHAVEGLSHRFQSRMYRVLLVFMVFLGLIIGTFYFLAPQVKEQTATFFRKWPDYAAQADEAIYDVAENFPTLKKLLAKSSTEEKNGTTNGDVKPQDLRTPIIQPMVTKLTLGLSEGGGDQNDPNNKADLDKLLNKLTSTVANVLGVTSAFLLSILFSCLIVLDLPKLKRMVAGLANTKLDFIYEEVAGNIHEFGKVLGRALEAQLFIAICNTILTAIGIWLMGIEGIVFLSTIVFFCSFIPVAGVFISSAPICLLALQSGDETTSGIQMMFLAIGLIMLIHFIEAYFLNPRIFGHHLRMNAVLVLIVLTVGGKVFGIWGLVLGLPVVNYVFGTAIRRAKEDEEKASAAA